MSAQGSLNNSGAMLKLEKFKAGLDNRSLFGTIVAALQVACKYAVINKQIKFNHSLIFIYFMEFDA